MANNILSTVELIEKANSILSKHSLYLDEAATSLNTYINSAKLPSDYVNSLKSVESINKKINKSTKDLERAEKQLQRQRISDIKLQQKREAAFDKYEKQLQREEKQLQRTEGLYNRVQRGVNEVTRKYQDLAIRKELNGKLTAEETVQLGVLEAKLQKYQNTLKTVDANIGKHQRNVGNYKSAFDGLGFSVAQLSRELPAFANSVQTGFMAISNNIPMLVDEITKLKQANIGLAASGKPTVSILKSVGKAIFSLNGMLGIGITILTVFAPKLYKWATGMDEAAEATKKANDEVKEQNKQLKENIRLRDQLLGKTTDLLNTIQYSERLKQIWESGIFESKTNEAFLSELSDRLESIGVNEARSLKDTNLLQSDRVLLGLNLLQIEKEKQTLAKERMKIDSDATEDLSRVIEIQKRINQLNEANQQIISKTVEIENKRDTKVVEKQVRDLQELQSYLKKIKADYAEIYDGIEDVERFGEAWENTRKKLLKLQADTEKFLSGFSDSFIKQSPLGSLATFFDGSLELLKAGADTTEEKFAVTFNAIAESAQQAFSFINQLGQQNFDNQYERLEQQKELALQFAGDTASSREEIERQYEVKRRSIQRRQAESQKKQAMFNIGIDTAQAIVSTLAKTPPPAGLPLAALMATIGAAQLALVASQQIPQFWQGGIVGGQQQIMVNDDPYGKKGSNYKEVIEKPNGQILTPQGKNVKMTVPKGSIVHPTYDAFINSLDNQLLNNNIMPIGQSNIMPMVINNGLTKSEILDVMHQQTSRVVNTINNKHGLQINIDERGFHKYIRENNNERKIMNARFSGRGLNV